LPRGAWRFGSRIGAAAAPVVSVEQREKDTNAALLKTLVERRALVAASSASNKQAALDFMDSRIAEIKKRLK
jgi:hypothetical protein